MAISTILVIEDDRFIGEMYVRSLKMAGYNVEWAVDGHLETANVHLADETVVFDD